MKKHLLIITALCLSATSCRSTNDVTHIKDTVYIAQHQYDSIFIDRHTTAITSHDTVYVDRLKTEYRYRLKTDTLHHYHTDTVCTTIAKQAPDQKSKTPIVLMVIVIVIVVVVAIVLVISRHRSDK